MGVMEAHSQASFILQAHLVVLSKAAWQAFRSGLTAETAHASAWQSYHSARHCQGNKGRAIDRPGGGAGRKRHPQGGARLIGGEGKGEWEVDWDGEGTGE